MLGLPRHVGPKAEDRAGERLLAQCDLVQPLACGGDVDRLQIAAAEGASVAYQWIADGTPVAGATDATFAPTADLVGAELTVRATVSADGYVAQTLLSAPTQKVKKAPGKP